MSAAAHPRDPGMATRGERDLPRGAAASAADEPLTFDPTASIGAVRQARRRIAPVTTIDLWLDRQAEAIELGAPMLAAVGTPNFFQYGRRVYGEPTAPLRYLPLSPLDLAQNVLQIIASSLGPLSRLLHRLTNRRNPWQRASNVRYVRTLARQHPRWS